MQNIVLKYIDYHTHVYVTTRIGIIPKQYYKPTRYNMMSHYIELDIYVQERIIKLIQNSDEYRLLNNDEFFLRARKTKLRHLKEKRPVFI